ncbi:amino acid adenylation domain-containing protein [Xenorhabdus ishibashii]|uniref:Pyoverdine synthetase D n=1 Tax=Xenorhabdus ishibashii TaxID=1034471 RepID=A0A2D0KHU3_9GAMM|nr:amino acid adenylation domain-containing protein [Xenorhabdus ishibashii]PHM62787.1 pyoverdine synthetase D [Xenorhabdus ishibashii]
MIESLSMECNKKTMLSRFFIAAKKYPKKIAIKENQRELSYHGLQNFIINISNELRNRGVKPGDKVAVALSHSVELIATLFAVQCVGAAYIPIDKKAPKERNHLIINDACPVLIINDDSSILHHRCRTENINFMINATPTSMVYDESLSQEIAYIIYTSGTTGYPKGVPITHENLLSLFNATECFYRFNETDTTLLYHSYAFDFSVWEIWSVLAYGGRLVIPDEETRITPYKLAKLVKDEKVTLLNQTPTAFSINSQALAEFRMEELSLRFIIFGGERLNFQTLRNWYQQFGLNSPQLVNMYGITETTIHASWHVVNENDLENFESTIGYLLPGFDYIIRPISNDSVTTESGELLLSGNQVTKGYLNDETKSKDKFIWLEINGIWRRYYCSGDLVSYNERGELVYCGRRDQQVKINGYRIEIGEIESVLARYEKINDISVMASYSEVSSDYLICFFTSSAPAKESIGALTNLAKENLPIYMRPLRYRKIETMPKTINGKIDKKLILNYLE